MDVNDIINKISGYNTIHVLCGAGISRASHLPTVDDIYDSISHILLAKHDDDRNYLLQRLKSHEIPFELIIEFLIKNTGNDELIDIYEHGVPTEAHHWIAELKKARKIGKIVTTNFDCLIEQALHEAGVQYTVKFTEDDFDKIDPIVTNQVIKIHGTAGKGKAERESIRITIAKIAGKELNEKRKKIIQDFFTHKPSECVIVLGYSFSDIFDINPFIQQCPFPLIDTYVIQHASGVSLAEEVSLQATNNPFYGKSISGYRIKMDTAALLKHNCWKSFRTAPKTSNQTPDIVDYRKILTNSILGIRNEAFKNYLIGNFFNELGEYKRATGYLTQARSLVADTDGLKFDIILQIGLIQQKTAQNRAEWETALTTFSTGLETLNSFYAADADNKKFLDFKSVFLYHLGRIQEDYFENGQAAFIYYEQSLRIDLQLKHDLEASKTLHQIGSILCRLLQKYDDAIAYFEKSIVIKQKLGYLSGLCRSYFELAVVYYKKNEIDNCRSYLSMAGQLAIQLGDIAMKRIVLDLQAKLFDFDGNTADSLRCYREKLATFAPGEKTVQYYTTIYAYSQVLVGSGQYSEAVTNLDLSIKGFQDLDVKDGQNKCLLLKGLVYYYQNQMSEALNISQQLITNVDLPTTVVKGGAHFLASMVYWNMSDLKAAKQNAVLAEKYFNDCNEIHMMNQLQDFLTQSALKNYTS